MPDALDLIAEARSRQEKAEREMEHWKARAAHERRRCKAVIDMAKRRPIEPPPRDAKWEAYEAIVAQFVEVVADPYAAYGDEEYGGLTHAAVQLLLAYRLHDLIEAARKS